MARTKKEGVRLWSILLHLHTWELFFMIFPDYKYISYFYTWINECFFLYCNDLFMHYAMHLITDRHVYLSSKWIQLFISQCELLSRSNSHYHCEVHVTTVLWLCLLSSVMMNYGSMRKATSYTLYTCYTSLESWFYFFYYITICTARFRVDLGAKYVKAVYYQKWHYIVSAC